MRTYNIREAKIQLSKLVELAAKGEPFVIAKDGKPMVKVVAMEPAEPRQMTRFGFLAGQIQVPEDFNAMGAEEIQRMFGDEP